MKIFKTAFFSIFILTAFPTFAAAGPFGTSMGDSLDKYPGFEHEKFSHNPDEYVGHTMPRPHPLFTDYTLIIPDKYGLIECSAKKNFGNDYNGALAFFYRIYEQLVIKYGKVDEKVCVNKPSRFRQIFWNMSNRDDKLVQVKLFISKTVPAVWLTYRYEDSKKYDQEVKEKDRKLREHQKENRKKLMAPEIDTL